MKCFRIVRGFCRVFCLLVGLFALLDSKIIAAILRSGFFSVTLFPACGSMFGI